MAEKDELLDHDYDGIQEYDNDLPRWWIALFWLTIAFAVVRVGYYHFGPGLLQEERLAVDMAALEEVRSAHQPVVSAGNADSLLALVSDADALAKGQEVFTTKCLACHGPQAQGLVGPNLTDDYWIHGGALTDLKRVVVEGVPEKGMIAWGALMPESEINAVVAYIRSLRGTNPPNPKQPEGALVEFGEQGEPL
ncbi:MAG: c-type cytochrome [Bdellovibrionales bacterium]|nr:c-type cytochrome [Bdellovibrionales bacterium]